MRKGMVFLVITMLAVMVILTGCNNGTTESRVTNDLSDTAYEVESELEEIRAESSDELFWNSTDTARILIEKTLERRTPFSIGFRLETPNGETILLEDSYGNELFYINDVWRKMISGDAILVLASSKPVVEAHKNGKSLEVTGVIIKWQNIVDRERRIFSVCDLSGDGQWDYVTEGKIFFAEGPAIGMKDEKGNPLGIDQIEIRRTKLVEIEEDLTFSKLAELALEEG
ncbi:hypothetical protein IKF92_00680 [Candidatus Saccharibacteria bacterium]|nr:hypothetical protein [Candidatus Saccharibacteria bacterium]